MGNTTMCLHLISHDIFEQEIKKKPALIDYIKCKITYEGWLYIDSRRFTLVEH